MRHLHRPIGCSQSSQTKRTNGLERFDMTLTSVLSRCFGCTALGNRNTASLDLSELCSAAHLKIIWGYSEPSSDVDALGTESARGAMLSSRLALEAGGSSSLFQPLSPCHLFWNHSVPLPRFIQLPGSTIPVTRIVGESRHDDY